MELLPHFFFLKLGISLPVWSVEKHMACTKDSLLITRNYYFGPTGYGHFIEITEEMNQSRVTLFLYLHGCHKEAFFFYGEFSVSTQDCKVSE